MARTLAAADRSDLGFPVNEAFEKGIEQTVAGLPPEALRAAKVITVSGNVGPWLSSGLELERSDRITFLVGEKRWLSFCSQFGARGEARAVGCANCPECPGQPQRKPA